MSDQVLAIATTRKKLRFLIAALAALLTMLLAHVFRVWCAAGLLPFSPKEELGVLWLLVCLYVCAAVTAICYGFEFLQRELEVQGNWLVRRTRGLVTHTVDLDNVAELQIRRQGSFWAFGFDVGVGLVLKKPEYRGLFGVRAGGVAWVNRRLLGCHLVIPDVYDRPSEEVAAAIANAVKTVQGRDIPIQGLAAKPASLGEAVPRGTDALDDSVCVSCGYALRGLQRTGVCPECGFPIRESTRSDVDWNVNAQWVARLHRGSVLLFLTGLLWLMVIIASWRLVVALVGGTGTVTSFYILLGSTIAALLLTSAGTLIFTAPRPTVFMTRPAPRTRRFARYALSLLLVPVLASLRPVASTQDLILRILCLGGTVLVLWTVLALYVRYLLTQLRRPILRSAASFVALLYGAMTTVLLAFIVVVWLSGVIPEIGQAIFPPSKPPSDAEMMQITRVFAVLITVFPASFCALFAAMWYALRRLRVQQRGG
ncbi:MAG: hypothetical protein KAV82_02075 [Phycisphaerae bacterium]|nr:hypothetical protein [Phycisphaerae bacterium]